MALVPGAEVLVISLNRRGEIEAVVRPGTYRVRVGSMTTTAREEDLRPVQSKRKRAPVAVTFAAPERDPTPESRALAALDLHGLTVDEARNRVAAHISRAILAGLERVEIVHGIGTGRLKAAVTADLKKIAAVRRVTPHPSNPGVVIAYF